MSKDFSIPLAVIATVILCASSLGRAEQTVGLFLNDEASFDGYTLFAPSSSFTTYLINNEGKLVHSWSSQHRAVGTAYLLENGELLRVEKERGVGNGRVKKYAWDSTVLWDVLYNDDEHMQHHDVEPLPNGNVLMITWEVKSKMEAIEAGKDPAGVGNELWPLRIIEVQPDGVSGGNIVWDWHVWDHLVQDFDPTKSNFGIVADDPGLMDLNHPGWGSPPDWLHANSIDYNETLDQILLSLNALSESWIIDHSTTSREAAGHTGGNSGRGGDILYRWGNPANYDRGSVEDQKTFFQHDARWIESGLPGAGNIMVFNNGWSQPGGNASSVYEIEPPIDEKGHYTLVDGSPYGPEEPTWTYTADPPTDFFAQNRSGAHRLPNGDTLICHGPDGIFFEVTHEGDTVWKYVNPVQGGAGPVEQGQPAGFIVFRNHRYAPDYPGLDGKDLTPGDPIELFDQPVPTPDGSGTTQPLTCQKGTVDDVMRLFWDPWSCPAEEYNLVVGNLTEVAGYVLQSAECTIGTRGTYNWTGVPSGDLYFIVVGVDGSGCYEGSWGTDSSGKQRNGTAPSNLCGVTTKDISGICR